MQVEFCEMGQYNRENTHSTKWGWGNISSLKCSIHNSSRFFCRFNDLRQRFCKKLTFIELAMQNASKQGPGAKSIHHLTSGDPNYSQDNEIQI